MNSAVNKETKNAVKAQKKTQKSTKKQQQKLLQQHQQQQQQQQQQHQQQNEMRNGKNAIIQQNMTSSSAGKSGKVNATTTATATTGTTTTTQNHISKHTTTGNSNSNNNNNHLTKDGIFLRPHVPIPRTLLPGYENAPKFERSNSFSLKGKLSKFINSLTGSKENISKLHGNNNNNEYDENGLSPYKFTRSRSMILLRRSNRRSLIEPQLEQLSEESEKFGNDPTSPASPRKNSLDSSNETIVSGALLKRSPVTATTTATNSLKAIITAAATTPMPITVAATTTNASLSESPSLTPNRRKSMSAKFASSTPNDPLDSSGHMYGEAEFAATADPDVRMRKGSTLSLTVGTGNGVPSTTPPTAYNPQLAFQKRRSNTLISSFRTTLASLTGATSSTDKKKEKMNPKWSASLQSLQAIDNMVSYENMSFIDYDKFNGYEKEIEKRLSTLSLMDTSGDGQQHQQQQQQLQHQISVCNETAPTSAMTPPTQTTVVRRRRKVSVGKASTGSTLSVRQNSTNSAQNVSSAPDRSSYNFDTDYEHNLDKVRNVYRDSLDSRKLEILNDLSRDSFVLDKHIIDVLNLEDGYVGRRQRRSALRKQMSTGTFPKANNTGADVTDCCSNVQMKSKSLTHLDGLDSMVACPHGGTPPANAASALLNNRAKSNTVSSSEYFSISFSTETGQPDEEFIPATRGVTLAAAISPALRRRNLSFSQISIADTNPTSSFLEAGYSPLASSLDENTDVENLAGRHLVIIERDGNRKPLQKAASFGSRTRPARLLSSVSTEETSESAALPAKQLKQRWSGLFGIKNPQQSQLCELLNSYAKNGVPQRVVPPSIFMNPEMDAALNYLDDMHKSWRDFVESDDMAENEAKIQTAIWELVTTEVYYIHALQTVTDLFLACLEAIQHQNLLTDVDQHRLFANVREICEANIQFWTQHLYPMVAHSIATREPMDINFFEEGFITFATIFSPYTKYCAEQSSCQFYCKELNRNNALFTSYLAWCESQKMCNRLRLADILVRPMQRLTKYSLLLSAIKKPMTITEDIEAIETMIHCVENFVASVNNHLTQRQETERLKGVMARIESYDVLPNTNNEYLEKIIKQYSTFFDLCGSIKNVKPFHVRHLFMEGDHKFKDHMGKLDVHCFLFTDILLVCKNVAKKGLGAVKVIRQPYFTDRLLVHQTNNVLNCVYLNEFNLAVTAFTLQCSEAKNWFEALRRARMIYIKLKQTSANFESSHQSSISSSSAMVTNTSAATVSAPAAAPAAATAVTHATATMTTSATNALIMTTTADNIATTTNTSTMMIDTLSVRKSPLNSSFGSHVSSANNSHSGSVEWNDSRNISVDLEKTNSFSSDDGSGAQAKAKSPNKLKITTTSSANTLSVQPTNNLVQSLPNLNIQTNQHNKLCHTYSNNTLLVPGVRHTRNLLSPNFHNVSYPPPSPTRTTLRRTSAIPNNPPLVKTRNITSQSSINWHQIPATPTPAPTPLSPHATGCMANTTTSTPGAGAIIEGNDEVESLMASPPSIVPRSPPQPPSAAVVTAAAASDSDQQQQQQQKSGGSSSEYLHQQNRQHYSNETDV